MIKNGWVIVFLVLIGLLLVPLGHWFFGALCCGVAVGLVDDPTPAA